MQIYPEPLPNLRDAFDRAEPGVDRVITRYRDPGQKLRPARQNGSGRDVARAGLTK